MAGIYTIGHSIHSMPKFIEMLQQHNIQILADIRTYPGSRHCPQFNKEDMKVSLAEANIGYCHIPHLGGRRRGKVDKSGNDGWTHEAFRSYADHTMSDEFQLGFTFLEQLSQKYRVVYMCSEACYFKCHRRILSDNLKRAGWTVIHIKSDGSLEEHQYTKHAALNDKWPVKYPAVVML